MGKAYIIKKNGEIYWDLNTFHKHKSVAKISLIAHLELLVPRINSYKKEKNAHFYKEMTVEEFARDFEIVCVEF